jgi:hypothetical protein
VAKTRMKFQWLERTDGMMAAAKTNEKDFGTSSLAAMPKRIYPSFHVSNAMADRRERLNPMRRIAANIAKLPELLRTPARCCLRWGPVARIHARALGALGA